MTHRKKKRKRGRIPFLGAAALLLTGLLAPFKEAAADFPEDEAVHIQAAEIEVGTLIIGTHLIHIDALNDTIYQLALISAAKSGQNRSYYKSELGDGGWYEIRDAVVLEDIMAEGRRVEEQVIDALFFTHHTRSDYMIYDLKSQAVVSQFEINNPYDPKQMQELDSLKKQKDRMEKSNQTIPELEELFEKKLGGQEKTVWDERLELSEDYYRELADLKVPRETLSTMQKISQRLDATRRVPVLLEMADRLNAILEIVAASPEYAPNAELQKAAGIGINEVQSSMKKAADQQLQPGEGAMSVVEYDLIEEILQMLATENEDTQGAVVIERLEDLSCLYRMMDGKSIDPEREIQLLNDRLIPKAEQLAEETGSETDSRELEHLKEMVKRLDIEEKTESEWNVVYKEKQDLTTRWLQALDDEDLERADALEKELVSVDNQLSRLGSDEDGSYQRVEDMNEKEEAETSERDKIVQILEAATGEKIGEASAKENAAALMGIALFLEEEDGEVSKEMQDAAQKLLTEEAEKAAVMDKSQVFKGIGENPDEQYIPVDVLAVCISYRYIWDVNKKQSVLVKGNQRYEFQTYYIAQSYVLKEFQCFTYGLSGTGYLVLVDKKTAKSAVKISQTLLQKGGS